MSEVLRPEVIVSDAPNLANAHAVVAEQPDPIANHTEASLTNPAGLALVIGGVAFVGALNYLGKKFNLK